MQETWLFCMSTTAITSIRHGKDIAHIILLQSTRHRLSTGGKARKGIGGQRNLIKLSPYNPLSGSTCSFGAKDIVSLSCACALEIETVPSPIEIVLVMRQSVLNIDHLGEYHQHQNLPMLLHQIQ